MLKAVFFDFDGTIFHIERLHWASVGNVVEKHTGSPIEEDEHRAYVGLPYMDRIEHMLAMRGIADEDLVVELEKEARQATKKNVDHEAMLVPGVKQLINQLKEKSIRLAVVSSASRKRIEHDLALVNLLDSFETITPRDDVQCHKPHPEPYETTLHKLELDAKNVVAFEDSPPGTESAQLAGIPVIALKTTFEEQDLSRAQKTIHDFTEITIEDIAVILQ
jgi:HAD superfamily hydrolase (TIGR01509 family)